MVTETVINKEDYINNGSNKYTVQYNRCLPLVNHCNGTDSDLNHQSQVIDWFSHDFLKHIGLVC